MSIDKLFKGIALVAGVAVCCSIISFAILAWNEPGQEPPAGNVAAPINTGDSNQFKTGNLGFQTGTESGNPIYYWISRIGQSLAFLNHAGQSALEIGQDKNVAATTKFSAPEICLNGVCRTTWPDGGTNWTLSYSNKIPLPAGNKRVFVMANMPYNNMTSEAAADGSCQAVADLQNYGGVFKALVYFGSRNLFDVLPAGNSFWKQGATVGDGMYKWNLVAASPAGFFTASPGGDYLLASFGDSISGAATGFAPKGDGTYNPFNDAAAHACINAAATRHKGPCYYGNDNNYYCILGVPARLDEGWATFNDGAPFISHCADGFTLLKTCNGFSICYMSKVFFPTALSKFDIYCIEQ